MINVTQLANLYGHLKQGVKVLSNPHSEVRKFVHEVWCVRMANRIQDIVDTFERKFPKELLRPHDAKQKTSTRKKTCSQCGVEFNYTPNEIPGAKPGLCPECTKAFFGEDDG